MTRNARTHSEELPQNSLKSLYHRHFQGALVRSGASAVMWLFALTGYLLDRIAINHFTGISVSVLYLIFMNPPTLVCLKWIKTRRLIGYYSLFINFLEIIGYTSVIYFLGGIEATYLTLIYASLITYVGVISPGHFPFLLAGLCAIGFSTMMLLELTGVIPHQNLHASFHLEWEAQVFYTSVITGLLFVVAYISSYTAGLLKKNRGLLRSQNEEIKAKAERIERADRELREAHAELEQRVEERTADLVKINEQLKQEIEIRKETQLSLEVSEEKYRDLFNNVSDFLYQRDLDGNFLNYNQVFKDLFRISDNEPKPFNVRDIISDEFKHQYEDYRARLLERGSDEGHLKAMDAKGNEIIIEYKDSLMRDSKGEIIGVRGSGRDVTEKVLAARERKNLEAQLIRAQRLEALGTLAGGIAHNFNNLLMGIQGNASMAEFSLDADHSVIQNLHNIKMLVQSGSKLTQELLGYAREGRYEITPFDLNLLVRQSAKTFGETRKDITISLDLSDNLLGIKGDTGQIEQVLINLFVNAADAMPNGGNLYLKTRNMTHDDLKDKPYKANAGNYAFLEVHDTGLGMDEETAIHIFEPFFTTKGLGKGTGLGLSSVYGIIKGHGGYIDVDSQAGSGTSFLVYLPATGEEVSGSVVLPRPVESGHEVILVVDDEQVVMNVCSEFLTHLGYHVLQAGGGREALAIYEEHHEDISLVILDMVMPEMGGGQTYDALKKAYPDVKVILSSGYSIDGQAREILDRGCDGFLQKPFDLEGLSAKIREILNSPG